MKKVLIIAGIALSFFGCDRMEHLEVGGCREYRSGLHCTPEQFEYNRRMISQCTINNTYNYCVNVLGEVGCVRSMFVICRQDDGSFMSFNKKGDGILPNQVPDYYPEQSVDSVSTIQPQSTQVTE